MNILVGVVGKPRSGKDSFADLLVEKHGFRKYAFADYLKWLCMEYFDVPKDSLWGNKTAESRKLLQSLGKLMTDIDPNFFVDRVVDKIKADYEESQKTSENFRVVISDVRRKEELVLFDRGSTTFLVHDTILDSGVSLRNAFDKMLVVKMERDIKTILKEEPGLEENIKHPIESLTDVEDNWDYYVDNKGTIDGLKANTDALVSLLTGEPMHDCN